MPAKTARAASRIWLVVLCIVAVSLVSPVSSFGAPLRDPFARVVLSASAVAVTTTSDTVDGTVTSLSALSSNPGPDNVVSLREALLAANATSGTNTLTISFAIPAADPGYDAQTNTWHVVLDNGPLPILKRGGMVIDGSSQKNGKSWPAIVLDGYNVYDTNQMIGFVLESANNTIRRITVMNFYDQGIVLRGSSANNNRLFGLFVGTSPTGDAVPDLPSGTGILITSGAHHNTIGGLASGDGNLISGTDSTSGVVVKGAGTANLIQGNTIGLKASGKEELPNRLSGVDIASTTGTIIKKNIIAGNLLHGVLVSSSTGTSIVGNTIGLGSDGTTKLGNGFAGIVLLNSTQTVVGGTDQASHNVIVNNVQQGIRLNGSSSNIIIGNYVGTTAGGIQSQYGNLSYGIYLEAESQNNTIGGLESGAANVVVYNGAGGIGVNSNQNLIQGNKVGVGTNGVALGNQSIAVRVVGDNNVVGPYNQIAYSPLAGLYVAGNTTTVLSNTLENNSSAGVCISGNATMLKANTIQDNGGNPVSNTECKAVGGVVITGSGGALLQENEVHNNAGIGVVINQALGNSLKANSITGNNVGIVLMANGNGGLAAPQITSVQNNVARGVACPGCRVEIFTDQNNEGRTFVDATTADQNGDFTIQVDMATIADPFMTATNTDQNGNTSPFAEPAKLREQQFATYLPLTVR